MCPPSAAKGQVRYHCTSPSCPKHSRVGVLAPARFGNPTGDPSEPLCWYEADVPERVVTEQVENRLVALGGRWHPSNEASAVVQDSLKPTEFTEGMEHPRRPIPNRLAGRAIITPDYDSIVSLDDTSIEDLKPSGQGYSMFSIRPTFPPDVILGAEVEVEYLPRLQPNTLSGPYPIPPKAIPADWFVKSDGSLRAGYEFTSAPSRLTVEFARQVLGFFRALRELKYAATPRCGGHLHFSVYDKPWDSTALRKLGRGWNVVAPIFSVLSRPNRVNSSHACVVSYAAGPELLMDSSSHDLPFGGPSHMYTARTLALNIFGALAAHGTVEIRAPQGTLDTRRFFANVLWGAWLVHWAHQPKPASPMLPTLEGDVITPSWLESLARTLGAPPRTAVLMARSVEHYAKSLQVTNVPLWCSGDMLAALSSMTAVHDQYKLLAIPTKLNYSTNVQGWNLKTLPQMLYELARAHSWGPPAADDSGMYRHAANALYNLITTLHRRPPTSFDTNALFADVLWGASKVSEPTKRLVRDVITAIAPNLVRVCGSHSSRYPERTFETLADLSVGRVNFSSITKLSDSAARVPNLAARFASINRGVVADCFIHHRPLYDPHGFIPWAGQYTAMTRSIEDL